MIKNLIFDFGDVFINLDKSVVARGVKKYGGNLLNPGLQEANDLFEVGALSPSQFVDSLQSTLKKATREEIIAIWNAMLLDFPQYRLDFAENLAKEGNYRMFLLSNTNALHIPHVEQKMGSEKYARFKNCFEQFYLSHEIELRKPNLEIFEFVLHENRLKAEETLFIDDTKENTDAAKTLGIQTWNLQVGKEDVTELKTKL